MIMQKRAQFLGKDKVDPIHQTLFMKRREQFWDVQSVRAFCQSSKTLVQLNATVLFSKNRRLPARLSLP